MARADEHDVIRRVPPAHNLVTGQVADAAGWGLDQNGPSLVAAIHGVV